jgi:hypothetical protein
MPRVPETILNSVFYLYKTADDAETGEANGGTGFLVSVQRDEQSPRTLYAVSNWHVVGHQPLSQATVARINTGNGGYEILDELMWDHHPSGDDLAVARVGFGTEFVYDSLRSTLCLNGWEPGDIEPTTGLLRLFGPGNEVLFVGRYSDHEGRERNFPVVRFGNIAMMPWEPIENKDLGFDQESFVVEARSFGGFSGSPVIVYPEAFITSEGVFDTYVGMNTWLLGIVWGHGDLFQRVLGPDHAPLEDKWWVKQNSGLMYVVPSWKLLEMLMSDEEVALRAKQDADWDEEEARKLRME